MTDNTIEIMDAGLDCLIENLGLVNAERFIATVKKENFDYTAWQREYFDRMRPGQIAEEAAEYARANPHEGRGKRL